MASDRQGRLRVRRIRSMINLSFFVRRELRLCPVALLLLSSLALPSLSAREKKDALQYGEGLIVNVPFPESEVMQAVEDVVQNGIIRGTKEYNKDEYVDGAKPADSSHAFPPWTDAGKVFYKVRSNAIDPRNFKNGGDVGTLTVRYVVQAQGDSNTVLRIDAVFVEDFRKTVHASDGRVESSEYKDIHDHLEVIELMKEQTAEAEKTKAQQYAKKQRLAAANDKTHVAAQPSSTGLQETSTDSSHPDTDPSPSQPLEQRVRDLRRQVVRVVKAPGAPLKSAPFHSASTLLSVTEGTEVLIVVSTPYWYGVETHEGQHGWMRRDQLEQAP
jgi:hypothetical protein